MSKPEIISLEDIKRLVDVFYGKVRKDALLSPIFEEVIGDHWDTHLNKMYQFWQTVLLEEHTYYGSPFLPHIKLPIKKQHFDQWLLLFNETLDTEFTGEVKEQASWRAQKMAEMFRMKLEYMEENNSKPLI
ncbi:group III truncated hemoglobin [Galbibacter sp.]|jgi:hemoglobin|uniref:group III truncated hemoglobin n=1 Tax=Galbibacter sp. TaxID=2918471 RepID=UPI003A8D9AB8